MKKALKVLAISGLIGTLVGCTASTESTEVGVRTAKVFGKGVVQESYPPGATHFFFRPFSDWDVFDISVQNLQMLKENNDAVRFKTIDGNDVWVDITIAWSIDSRMAPQVVQFVGETTDEVESKLVRPVTRTVVRDVLNQLTSEQYYNAQERFTMAERAKERLNSVLNREGVVIDQVLLGEHKFNDTYMALISDKKVAEQEAERLTSQTEAEVEAKRLEFEKLTGQIAKAKELAIGEAEKRKRNAEAIRYERETQGASIRIEGEAKAEGMRERARALAGSGGRNIVKMKVAESLKGKNIVFVPAGSGMDLRSTDMNALLQTYGVTTLAK